MNVNESTNPTEGKTSKPVVNAAGPAAGSGSHEVVIPEKTVRYILKRRLGRTVETLVSDTVGDVVPVHLVHRSEGDGMSFSSSRRDNPYCKLVYSSADGRQGCSNCYRNHLEQAQRLDEPLTYTCHAGLTNVMVPIKVRGKTLGGLLIGRVFTKRPSEKQKQKIADSVNQLCAVPAALKAIAKVPVVTEDNLQLAALIARNLARAETPLLLESHVFNPAADPPAEGKALTPTFPVPDAGATDGRLLRHRRICRRVAEILELQYAAPVSVAKLADSFKLTPNYLSTMFHKTMGVTISDYLLNVRIQKAKSYLQRADINVKEVAFRVGFGDASHFAVVFKRETGYTPTDWRARLDEKILDGTEPEEGPAMPGLEARPPA